MPYGIPQSALYAARGSSADGLGVRNRGGEQFFSGSGNPGLPIFNTARLGAPTGGGFAGGDPRAMRQNMGMMPQFSLGSLMGGGANGPGLQKPALAPAQLGPTQPSQPGTAASMPAGAPNYLQALAAYSGGPSTSRIRGPSPMPQFNGRPQPFIRGMM